VTNRIEKNLLATLDELERLREERRVGEAELEMHRHINDDAQRDAALGMDRLEATATRDEVARFERLITSLNSRIALLEERRLDLQRRLAH
jgi:hypothetical protein